MVAHTLTIDIGDDRAVSGILTMPEASTACLVLAHGAGAGMNHPFMATVADGLADRGMATLRYQFPYMERGSKRPDAPPLAQTTVRAAVGVAARLVPQVTLLAGGKSFGGRMTSQAQAQAALPGVSGLVFLGFPLHPAGKPSAERARHLAAIQVPMLFLQGTRDALADQPLLTTTVAQLPLATLKFFDQADHSFHVPARSGQTDQQILDAMLDALVDWSRRLVR